MKDIKNVVESHNYLCNAIDEINFEDPDYKVLDKYIKETDEAIETCRKQRDELNEKYNEAKNYLETNMDSFYKKAKIFMATTLLPMLIWGFTLVVFSQLNILGENAKTLTAVSFLPVLAISIVLILVSERFHNKGWKCYTVFADVEEKLNNKKHILMHLFLLNTLCKSIYDKKTFKTIYQHVYDVQEYLRENDSSGFESFERAFNALNIDLSKYTNKVHSQEA